MIFQIDKTTQQAHILRNPELLAEAYEANAPLNLRVIAFENYHAPVLHAWLNLAADERREALRDRYVFFSVCCQFGTYLGDLVKQEFQKANGFVAEVMGDVSFLSQGQAAFSEEWFRGLDHLAATLIDRNYLPEARQAVAIGFRTGVVKFPRVSQSLAVHAAYLDALVGRREKASKVALRLVHKPYLLPDRRELPRLYEKLMFILAASNHISEYRLVLWKGVSSFHTSAGTRDTFVAQIVKTYRGVFRVFLHSEIPLSYRLPFLLAFLAKVVRAIWPLGLLRADAPIRWLHWAALYLLDLAFHRKPIVSHALIKAWADNRSTGADPLSLPDLTSVHRILVTRAMGGMGDLLMMTPGLKALSMKYPQAQIDFAIPKAFHPTFEGLTVVRLLDIDEDDIELSRYHRWINLTHCPAGQVESRQYPNVRTNRIEIFARAMGIGKRRLRRTAGFLPFYRVKPEEQSWAEEYLCSVNPSGRPVIAVQPFAADSYRNWPHMETLVQRLSSDYLVLLFHHEDIPGFDFDNVIKVKQTFRRCAALVSQCFRLVVVDSSFLHLSGALGIPTIAVVVATSGYLRTRDYPNVRVCTPDKSEFPCYPCWRFEHKPCHLTNGRESICGRSITVEHVLAALKTDVAQWRVETSLWGRLKTWIRYGRE